MNVTADQMSASSGTAENGVLKLDEQTEFWQADDGDSDEAFVIDLGDSMAVTGLTLRTTSLQKVRIQGSIDGTNYNSKVVS